MAAPVRGVVAHMAMADVGQENGTPIDIRHSSGQPIVLIQGRRGPRPAVRERRQAAAAADQGPHLHDGGGGPYNVAWTHPDVVNPTLLDFVKG
ncbi:hypothetical protein [Streptomyces sp. NPDC059460]|uniref:hypothetical protein n=1 Tax=Streptomyces sp. NPDC059460 TaxID=3346840 RepID=UPI0036AB906B